MAYVVKTRKGEIDSVKDDVVSAVRRMRRVGATGMRVVRERDGVVLAVNVPIVGAGRVMAEVMRAERATADPLEDEDDEGVQAA